jgi:hypothetical protein
MALGVDRSILLYTYISGIFISRLYSTFTILLI